ncbi:MAG TPA: IS630 family transposase, partial [Candidatus Dormibacteraeota bacterium]|nr:IS630 family transposase [Candidatus Dormibacteraeota bacterium]
MVKRDGRRLGRGVLAHIRLQAVREIREGESPETIARRLGFCRQIVYKWIRRAREQGVRALQRRFAPGAKPRLNPQQIRELKQDVQRPATAFGFVSDLWTIPRLRVLLQREFRVALSRSGLWEFLRREGLSPQRPLKRALERDEVAVRRWLRTEYPRIRVEARKIGAILYFGDERGVRTDHVSGRTWAVRGHTPEIRRTSRRAVVSLLSAMTPRGELLFMTSPEKVNSTIFIRFLRKLLAHHRRRKIVLIVDRSTYHRSRVTRGFVAAHRARLRLEYLPANAPDLNPDEHVWSHLKGSGATDST